jgi:hypothetical protein
VALRIGIDQRPKNPPYLVQFGRREHNDVILNNRFSRNTQCFFDFNQDTGELLLHDISERNDTELYDLVIHTDQDGNDKEELGTPQIWKNPRKCVVVLSPDCYGASTNPPTRRQSIFTMRGAEFRLVPPRAPNQDDGTLLAERLAFAGRDPSPTIENTLQRIFTLGLESLRSQGLATTHKSVSFNPHYTSFKTPLEPKEANDIRFTKLRPLGRGGQGEVHQVVDMYTGDHYACKTVAVHSLSSERDLKMRIEMEVNLIRASTHVSYYIYPSLPFLIAVATHCSIHICAGI